jgi:phosphatidylglycerol---prolipoprotein diacylglyceryl transferase
MQPFSILIGLGTLAGLVLVSWRAPQKDRLRYLDAALLTLVGALLGGRLVAVAVDWAYYGAHPGEIFQVWKGGLSGIGALVGGALVVIILSSLWKIPLGVLADAMLPLAGTLTIAAWMGCWMDGCSYGLPANAWWALPARDEWGVVANRIPVQLIGAILTLLLIWLLDWGSRYFPVQGLGAAIGLFGLSAVIFGLSYLRIDPTPIQDGLRLEAWGALGLMIFSIIAVVVLLSWWKLKSKQRLPG